MELEFGDTRYLRVLGRPVCLQARCVCSLGCQRRVVLVRRAQRSCLVV